MALEEKLQCEECNVDPISQFLCLCLNCICLIDLNNSAFEFSSISLTGRPVLITGHIFYCDYKFKWERQREGEKKGNFLTRVSDNSWDDGWNDGQSDKIYMGACCCQSLQDHPVKLAFEHRERRKTPITFLMSAWIINISEKSKIASFTLMRYLQKVLIVIILEKIGSLFLFSFFPPSLFQNARLHLIISNVVRSSGN